MTGLHWASNQELAAVVLPVIKCLGSNSAVQRTQTPLDGPE